MAGGGDQAGRDERRHEAANEADEAGQAIEGAGATYWSIKHLTTLSDAEVVEWQHRFMLSRRFALGPDDFRDEFTRRKAERAAESLTSLTRALFAVTIILVVLTAVIVWMTAVLIAQEG